MCISKIFQRNEKSSFKTDSQMENTCRDPSGIKVANKTGETSTVQHDMAIVYGKKTDYVICVFSSTGSESYAVPRIQSISRTVYQYLNK